MNLYAGARLSVHPYINTTEGGIQDVCVLADCNSQLCERRIPISLLLLFNCSTCGTAKIAYKTKLVKVHS